MMTDDCTPLMKQYGELKQQASDALLLFRMGDFYELFGEDAITASKILDITLTSRNKNKTNPTPMAGVPHHSAQGYIQKLLNNGKKVAIAEQMEDASLKPGAKAIVRREIVRVFTPAIQFDQEGAESLYLATALATDDQQWVLACLEASTGEVLVSQPMDSENLYFEISGRPIKHFLRIGHSLAENVLGFLASGNILTEDLPENFLSIEQADQLLKKHYEMESISTFFSTEAAVRALGILLKYTIKTQNLENLIHLKLPVSLRKSQSLVLGPRTVQHLDLITTPEGGPGLFQFLNSTSSAMGSRLLKHWIVEPLKKPEEIEKRQKAVRELFSSFNLTKLQKTLSEVYDLERICGRVNASLANPRDTYALGKTLSLLAPVASDLSKAATPLLQDLFRSLEKAKTNLQPLADRILTTQKSEPPLVSREGGIFNSGTSPDLDRLISLTENGQRWLIDLEAQERERTGIGSLKVRYNRVFGYYIEVTQAHLKNVPPYYQRKQTMVGAERFFTEELKKFEEEILTASAKQQALEQELFKQLVEEIKKQTKHIMELSDCLAEIDSLCALARLALEPGWSFPTIDDSLDLNIKAGRHPLVDKTSKGAFVPNDTTLSDQSRLTLLITGPNMGGKSTVMRQVALIVILGQMGAPVPCEFAQWGFISSLYTRIGAHDAIAKGQSTFMVEMSELAYILHNADGRSFIVLDEIGRGTSTYDGISVAWASLEWICNKTKARTLFATHYHELTRLAVSLPKLANAHMAVEGTKGLKGGDLRFLYKLKEGPTNESFGVHVARLAGLPKAVIDRAWGILDELEKGSLVRGMPFNVESPQLSLFEANVADLAPEVESIKEEENSILTNTGLTDKLININLDETTPIQALNYLIELQKEAKDS